MPKKYRRNHNLNRIKVTRSYTVEELAERMGVQKKTVYAWIDRGLEVMEGIYPILIHGSKLKEFHKKEKAGRKQPCKDDEMFCCKCHKPRNVLDNKIEVEKRTSKKINLTGKCAVCGTGMFRSILASKLQYFEKLYSSSAEPQLRLVGF